MRAWKRGWPAKGPPFSLMLPLSSNTLMDARPWRLPVAKSLGSCAGVILTAPAEEGRGQGAGVAQLAGSRQRAAVVQRRKVVV
jgi:hypothetical protein